MSNAKLPSFKLLIGFEAAARLGNYSRAADELFVSQSAISHQVAQLERQTGQALFRRKGRGVELTVAGKLLQESVVRSLEVIRNGLGRIDAYLNANQVTLVCPAPIVHGWLQPRVDRLMTEHPELCPIISVDETARYIDEMDVDIAITRQPLKQQGVFEVPLLTDELVTVGTSQLAARLPKRNLASHPKRVGLLCLETDMTDEQIGRVIRETFGAFRKVAIYDDPRLLLDAALRGRGLALVSHLVADEALRQGDLVILPGYPTLPAGTIWISRADGETRSPLVRNVFDCLLRYSQQN